MNIMNELRYHYIKYIQKIVNNRNKHYLSELSKRIDVLFSPKNNQTKLKIVYVMNHARVCGGVKILLEHTNHLVDRGHDVVILCRDDKPDWRDVKANFIKVPLHVGFMQMMPDVDIIVCTVADQLPECYSMQKAPVILFEQGDTYIYEYDKLGENVQSYFKEIWNFPVPVVGVSKILVDTLEKNFGRKGQVLHNALDNKYFYPRTNQLKGKPRILFVGQEENAFKGIKDIREALKVVRKSGRDFDEVWVTQQAPQSHFDGTLVVNPSQIDLGDIYRSCDIFVSGSYYESFPLPPLEAMTCGCAVISTNNKGVQEYGIDGYNCLFGRIGDPKSLAEQIMLLIDDYEKRMELVENGYVTSEKFNWESIILNWEQYLYATIEQWNNVSQLFSQTSLHIEVLPKGLSSEQVYIMINEVQLKLNKDWCLYLIEGETIDNESIEQIKRIISIGVDIPFSVQVLYSNDVPDHTIIRTEQRLLKRGVLPFQNSDLLFLPIKIGNANESYFLSKWLGEIRKLYKNRNYLGIIEWTKEKFSTLTEEEKLIATKWLILSLLELDRIDELVTIANEAIKQDITYSDISYLFGRVCIILGQSNLSSELLKIAQEVGSATHYGETFDDIKTLCKMYLP